MKERSILVDKMVCEILLQIKNGETPRTIISRLGDDIFDEAIEYCALHELIIGISPQRVANGNLTIDHLDNCGLTAVGESFISLYPDKHH